MRVRCYALQHLPFTPLCERSECLRWGRRILSKSPCQAKRSNGGQLRKNTRWGPSVRGDCLQHVLSLRVHENPNGFKRYGRVCRNLPLQFGIATCRKLAQRCWRSKRVFGGLRCAPGVRQNCPLPSAELNGTVPQSPCAQLPAPLRGGTIIGKYRADHFIAPRGELPKHRWGKGCVPCQLRVNFPFLLQQLERVDTRVWVRCDPPVDIVTKDPDLVQDRCRGARILGQLQRKLSRVETRQDPGWRTRVLRKRGLNGTRRLLCKRTEHSWGNQGVARHSFHASRRTSRPIHQPRQQVRQRL